MVNKRKLRENKLFLVKPEKVCKLTGGKNTFCSCLTLTLCFSDSGVCFTSYITACQTCVPFVLSASIMSESAQHAAVEICPGVPQRETHM